MGILILAYLLGLICIKGFYATTLGVSYSSVEPLEQFAFNWNAHTYETFQNGMYTIGVISL